ncbi:MAG: D-sedoheptulose 7-phosphate isomerase [Cytophagales bacterium]|nr:D-sedoheptulose 7-phosphate isomerase [Cytophagales bacterium]MDW8384614.1 D-sedoheptulose 7-phosphate isomerase [Flammeovirgaceae bacterium]
MQHLIRATFDEAANLLQRFLEDAHNIQAIELAAQIMIEALKNDKKIISAGNGGSHCDAMHFAEELSGKFRDDRPSYAAIAISDPSHISCVGNDYGFEYVFSRYLEGIGKKGDVFLGISTSGNSKNIIRAVETARKKEMKVVLLTGKDGGKLAGTADVEIRVPHFGYADRIQEVHIKIIHVLIMLIEKGMSA